MGHGHAHAHGHGHGHLHGQPLATRRADSRRRMLIALAINLALLVIGVVGGLITGSLAVLADAGHVLSDVGSIALGLLAAAVAGRAASPRRTFGLQRSEVLAALANGLALVVIGVLVVVAAIDRFGDPPEIEGWGVLAIGVVGLLGNVAATWVLARGDRSDLNLEGVMRHSLADALGSLAVVASGGVILLTGWQPIDPLISIVVAALILASSWRLVVEPLDVLMEAAPAGLDVEGIARAICEVEDVSGVHDLHVWTVTPGFIALAAHIDVSPRADRDAARRQIEFLLRERWGIEHTTLQMEEHVPPGGLLQLDGGERDDEPRA
jgi:cobalt-zinc-cadmium efflux system protein